MEIGRKVARFTVAFVAVVVAARAQPDLRPAEKVFKNVQSLKGISANEFMATMGFFTASLGESCTYCHIEESGGNWDRYADDNDHKRTARTMIAMVGVMNKNFFGGRRELTCYSCHRGMEKPQTTPDLEVVYGTPRFPPPDQLVGGDESPAAVDAVFAKYINALGGAQRVGALKSLSAKGTYQGYAAPKYAFEMFAKAPSQITTVIHGGPDSDTVTTFDGRNGWIEAPLNDRPQHITELIGTDLDGARLDAILAFPAEIRGALREWRVGTATTIDDRDVHLVQSTSDGRYPVNLYFDDESGLLVRVVRYSDTPVGLGPTQIDYADYREVAGIKIPYKRTVIWLDGRATILLNEVRPNADVEGTRFARPASR